MPLPVTTATLARSSILSPSGRSPPPACKSGSTIAGGYGADSPLRDLDRGADTVRNAPDLALVPGADQKGLGH